MGRLGPLKGAEVLCQAGLMRSCSGQNRVCLSGYEVLTPGAVLPGMAQLRAHIRVFHVRFLIKHVTSYLFSPDYVGKVCHVLKHFTSLF